MQVMLGEGDNVEAHVLSNPGQLDDLVEHPLPVFGPVGDRSFPQPLLLADGNGWEGNLK